MGIVTATLDVPEPGPWMQSVAELLPTPHKGPLPFTLGEAVAELGLWAGTARAESWANRGNRESLDHDVEITLAVTGPKLRAVVDDLLPMLRTSAGRPAILQATAEFSERWQQPAAVLAAFSDLCAMAAETHPVWDLHSKAEILASQIGAGQGAWSLLNDASRMLDGEPHPVEIKHWLGEDSGPGDLTPSQRLEISSKILTGEPATGEITVWLVYRRANVSFRVAAGPITFLRADWAVPNATHADGQEFDERDELRGLLEGPLFPSEAELLGEDAASEQYVLVRVDLGCRRAAGASDVATRLVESLLNIAVGSGGVSWVNTGTSVTLVDGHRRSSTFGAARRRERAEYQDTYGMNATADLLDHWAQRLDAALSSSAMSDFLVEALAAVREASMVDHRDVTLSNARPVTPRVAVALEDHAVELIASLAQMTPEDLVSALQDDEVDHQWDLMVLNGLLAPLAEHRRTSPATEDLAGLGYWLAPFDPSGSRVVHLDRVWESRSRLREVEVSPAVGATLERSLAAISSPAEEEVLLERAQRLVQTLRNRHRRVRNAVTHGNPVTSAAISSVRDFSDRLAHRAVNLALHSFATGETVSEVIAASDADRQADRAAMSSGTSRRDRIAAKVAAESPAPQPGG